MRCTIRIFWIDNLKAFGVFLVILGHMIPDSLLKQYIYSFHVPLFFFISGYLFNPTKYNFRQFLRKKFNTLIIPYLFFALISFLFWFFIVRSLSLGGKAMAIDPMKPLFGIFYGIGSGDWRVPMNIALWFLPCLFVVEIAFYFAKNWYFLLVFAVLGFVVTLLPFRLPWSSDVALSAIVFYGIRHFIRIYSAKGLQNMFLMDSHKALPLLFSIHLLFCFLNSPVDMNNLVYGNTFFFYISACSGILFYLGLSKLFIKTNRVIIWIGSNTIILIGLVGITWFILNGVSYILFKSKLEQSGLGFALVVSILQIGLTAPAIYCINAWLPFVIGRSYGQNDLKRKR
jgi:fucose 4-O-acetylase-like acetyltransferase